MKLYYVVVVGRRCADGMRRHRHGVSLAVFWPDVGGDGLVAHRQSRAMTIVFVTMGFASFGLGRSQTPSARASSCSQAVFWSGWAW